MSDRKFNESSAPLSHDNFCCRSKLTQMSLYQYLDFVYWTLISCSDTSYLLCCADPSLLQVSLTRLHEFNCHTRDQE